MNEEDKKLGNQLLRERRKRKKQEHQQVPTGRVEKSGAIKKAGRHDNKSSNGEPYRRTGNGQVCRLCGGNDLAQYAYEASRDAVSARPGWCFVCDRHRKAPPPPPPPAPVPAATTAPPPSFPFGGQASWLAPPTAPAPPSGPAPIPNPNPVAAMQQQINEDMQHMMRMSALQASMERQAQLQQVAQQIQQQQQLNELATQQWRLRQQQLQQQYQQQLQEQYLPASQPAYGSAYQSPASTGGMYPPPSQAPLAFAPSPAPTQTPPQVPPQVPSQVFFPAPPQAHPNNPQPPQVPREWVHTENYFVQNQFFITMPNAQQGHGQAQLEDGGIAERPRITEITEEEEPSQ